MSDMIPATTGAAPVPRSTPGQKVEQITALLSRVPTPRVEPQSTKPTEAPAETAAADSTKSDDPAQAETKSSAATIAQDPIVDLLSRLQVAAASFGERDAGLALGIDKLVQQAAEPGATGQTLFRTQVAYSLQDTEKALGAGRIAVPSELRTEMSRLADTSPGLQNKSMQALLASTREIDDRALVRDLRRGSASMATMGSRQNIPEVNEIVEMFENRVRLAPRAVPGATVTETAPVAATAAEPSIARSTASAPVAERAEAVDAGISKGIREEPRVAASPGDEAQRPRPSGTSQMQSPGEASVAASKSQPKTAMAQIMDNLRPASPTSPPPWSPPPVRMTERLAQFQQRLDQGKTDQLIQASEKSGVAMMKSIETFANGPGAAVLGKIDDAARTEPGGTKTVMQEMQPGGRYAALRTEFDNALQSDRVFAAAYNQVEKTGAQYGKDRLALNADFDAKKLDPSKLDARFQQADEAIGEAVERIPGRTPGKSAMDELGQRVAEMIGKAVQRVRLMFGRDAVAEPQSSASPSMSP